MKMLKKCSAVLLCVLICLGTFTASCGAVSGDDVTDTVETLAAEEDVQAIFSEFDAEIRYVEEKHCVTINELNQENLDLIKVEAVENLYNEEYCFVDLMNEIALASARYRDAKAVEDSGIQRTERPIISNKVTTVYSDFSALKGKYIAEMPVGVTGTVSSSTSIEVATGDVLKNVKIGVNFSIGFSYDLSGPEDGTVLSNGVIATHRVAFGILYGTIMKSEYDIYYPDTDYTHHMTEYYIDTSSAATTEYTMLASIGIPTYSGMARHTGVLYFSNLNEFRSRVETSPEMFI